MKPGQGAGYLLADIAIGATRQEIRERWQSGEYGKDGERPRGKDVAEWLRLQGQ